MSTLHVERPRIRAAWEGRVSGCLLGKPVEILSFQSGRAGVESYLREQEALPLRDYVPLAEGSTVDQFGRNCCHGYIGRAEPDDDINYTVLSLMLLEDKGATFATADVARAWLRLLPAGTTWTAERAAYRTLLNNMQDEFVNGSDPGFDLALCSDNDYNNWIGAQIRVDMYGWICPGEPELAADLARRDAMLSHRGEAVYGAVFIAALAASIPVTGSFEDAVEMALTHVPRSSDTAAAVRFGRRISGQPAAIDLLHQRYADISPVHSTNNLAVVIWALCSAKGDFGAAVGDAVTAGWDTDCNGATVGGLFGLAGLPIPESWTRPWNGRIGVDLAGVSELELDDLVERTIAVAESI